MEQISDKAKLLIMSSWGARSDPSSPLLRFVRDYAGILKKFEIHATGGTGHSMLASGLYRDEITCHRSGPDGGVVELAAMVARRKVGAVIFLSDPLDLRSDVPENFALQRVCREVGVRLINTVASAEEWALCGGETTAPDPYPLVTPRNWNPDGHKNVDEKGEPRFLSIPEQTIALIAHDKKKEEMVDFVNEHLDFLNKFHRILTTGTTGWLLKLLYADDTQRKDIETEANDKLGGLRFAELKEMLWLIRLLYADDSERNLMEEDARAELGQEGYENIQKTLEKRLKEKRGQNKPWPKLKNSNPQFVNGVMPLPSGPKGGDILISDEILKNQCHRIIFFHDPGTAHPHESDIRLLERTCQIRGVYAVCVSDRRSAHNSIQGL